MGQHKCESVWQVQETTTTMVCMKRANNVYRDIRRDGTEKFTPTIEKLIASFLEEGKDTQLKMIIIFSIQKMFRKHYKPDMEV